jgi:PAS domain S-box-containing protein
MNDHYHIEGHSREDLILMLNAYQKATDENIFCSITDKAGKIIYANQKVCEISRYSMVELLGQTHNLVNAGYHPDSFFKEMWETIESGSVWKGEVKNRAKDGSYYWLDSVIIPIKDADGIIHQYFSLRTLISDKKAAEEAKNQRIHELEELLHMLSHEVRQPVANILGISKIFEKYLDQPEELIKLLYFIKQSAESLDAFTRKLTLYVHELGENERK